MFSQRSNVILLITELNKDDITKECLPSQGRQGIHLSLEKMLKILHLNLGRNPEIVMMILFQIIPFYNQKKGWIHQGMDSDTLFVLILFFYLCIPTIVHFLTIAVSSKILDRFLCHPFLFSKLLFAKLTFIQVFKSCLLVWHLIFNCSL